MEIYYIINYYLLYNIHFKIHIVKPAIYNCISLPQI